MKRYEKVQFVANVLPTGRNLSFLGTSGPNITSDINGTYVHFFSYFNAKYLGSENLDVDSQARFEILKWTIEKAHDEVVKAAIAKKIPSGEQEKTLKIFMIPEFYFGGSRGVYGLDEPSPVQEPAAYRQIMDPLGQARIGRDVKKREVYEKAKSYILAAFDNDPARLQKLEGEVAQARTELEALERAWREKQTLLESYQQTIEYKEYWAKLVKEQQAVQGSTGPEIQTKIVDLLCDLVEDARYKDWLFVFGTILVQFRMSEEDINYYQNAIIHYFDKLPNLGPGESPAALTHELLNTAIVVKGGPGVNENRKATWMTMKEWKSHIDLTKAKKLGSVDPLMPNVWRVNINEFILPNPTVLDRDVAPSISGKRAVLDDTKTIIQQYHDENRGLGKEQFAFTDGSGHLRAVPYSGLAVFEMDNELDNTRKLFEPEKAEKITFGLEVCLDHSKQRLRQSPLKPGSHQIQIQLVPSGGMSIEQKAVVACLNGLVFNCDGAGAGHSQAARVDQMQQGYGNADAQITLLAAEGTDYQKIDLAADKPLNDRLAQIIQDGNARLLDDQQNKEIRLHEAAEPAAGNDLYQTFFQSLGSLQLYNVYDIPDPVVVA